MNRSRRPLTVLDPSGLSRRRFLVIGGGSLAALVTGCGGGQGAPGSSEEEGVGGFTGGEYAGEALTLAYWNGFTGGDGPAMDALVKDFQAEHELITVEQNTVEWATFYQKLPAASQAGKGPDVGVMHLDQLPTNAVSNVIVPIDDLAESLGLAEDQFAPAVWEASAYEDERYGIPLDVHTIAMYYNQDHFDEAGITEPPTDAASFDEAMQKLQDAGFDQPFWMPNLWPHLPIFLSLLYQFGGMPYGEDGSEATFASEAGVSALTWMREQIDKGYSPEDVGPDAEFVAFKDGRNSVHWNGIWQINDIQDTAKIKWALAPLPTIGTEPAAWGASHQFFLTSQAAQEQDRADAAKTFIGWMSEQSAKWTEAGMVPALNSAREDAVFTESPQAALKEQINNLRFLPSAPGLGGVTPETIEVALNQAILGRETPEDALSTAEDNAQELLAKAREQYGL